MIKINYDKYTNCQLCNKLIEQNYEIYPSKNFHKEIKSICQRCNILEFSLTIKKDKNFIKEILKHKKD